MDCRWCAYHNDDEYGTSSRRNETGYPESFGKTGRCSFQGIAAQRERWAVETDYVYPGPIQYFGPAEVCDQPTKTLQLEQGR